MTLDEAIKWATTSVVCEKHADILQESAFTIAREVRSLQARIETLIAAFKIEREGLVEERDECRKAAAQVMFWIKNWEPEFSYDPDWPADRDAMIAAIAEVTP